MLKGPLRNNIKCLSGYIPMAPNKEGLITDNKLALNRELISDKDAFLSVAIDGSRHKGNL